MAEKDQQQSAEYAFAKFEKEIKRLAKQHAWIQKCLGGRMVFAPVDLMKPGLRVLDMGCADG